MQDYYNGAKYKRAMKKKLVTILVPAFNEEESLVNLANRLNAVIDGLVDRFNFEVIILDNCSSDHTAEISNEIISSNKNWGYIRLSRNFGYHNSIACGFDNSKGDCLIVLAADLQEPPELIPHMLELWVKGNDVVYGVLSKRNDASLLMTIGAHIFYKLIYLISDSRIPINATDFRVISRRVVNEVILMKEADRYLRGIVHWIGFKQVSFTYDRDPRRQGKSKASLWYCFKWAINALVCFSYFPLRCISYFGILVLFASMALSFYFLWARFITDNKYYVPPSGVTVIALLVLALLGITSIAMGIIGEYVGRIYNQTKNRPLYIVDVKKNIVS